jgi:hypothetical protein
VCHKFLYGNAFRLQDLILEAPEESRASPFTREKRKKEWEALTRFIRGLEVSVNFKTTKRYPRRKIVDLYAGAGRYEFVLEKADKKEKRVVTVEASAVVVSREWSFLRLTSLGILQTGIRPAYAVPRRNRRGDTEGAIFCHSDRVLQA